VEKIGILASGTGSNAVKLLEHFKESTSAQVAGVFSNNMRSYVLQRFIGLGSDAYYFSKDEMLLDILEKNKITFLVLAGYNKLVPENVISAYKGKILNIHPALLPKHGGKGMYGIHVHQAVIDAKDKESGISIHHVTAEYDKGKVIFQKKIKLKKGETAKSLRNI